MLMRNTQKWPIFEACFRNYKIILTISNKAFFCGYFRKNSAYLLVLRFLDIIDFHKYIKAEKILDFPY